MSIVSLLRCEDYNDEDVKKSILASFENLGGIEKYIHKGERILLKVNLLMKKRPEEATTTHPVFVKALAQILIDYGAEVLIGDSPGGPFNEKSLSAIYKATGMEQVANDTKSKLNYNLNSIEKECTNGLLLKKILVTDMIHDVDKIISVSKLKTHGMATFTGAVKNMFGIIPGITKAEYHLNMPDIKDFANALIDICLLANPVLSFMDGIIGMEGDGPSAGEPRKVGVVIASDSPYHLDKVACSIISLPHKDVPTVDNCIKRGICEEAFHDITFLGDAFESFVIKDFVIPKVRGVGFIPKPFMKVFGSHVQPKPVFNHKDCVGCNICAENCPAKIITMKDRRPYVEISKCIRCFCCQELCPKKAVVIYRPKLLKIISKL